MNNVIETRIENAFKDMFKGFTVMAHSPIRIIAFICMIGICRYVFINKESLYSANPTLLFLVWAFPFVLLFGYSFEESKYDEAFKTIGFQNKVGEYPQFVKQVHDKDNTSSLVFRLKGKTIEDWR